LCTISYSLQLDNYDYFLFCKWERLSLKEIIAQLTPSKKWQNPEFKLTHLTPKPGP
jgi:hypothetical protein